MKPLMLFAFAVLVSVSAAASWSSHVVTGLHW